MIKQIFERLSDRIKRTKSPLIIAGTCILIFATCFLLTGEKKNGTLGVWFTDHYAHYMYVVLFFYEGFDIYRKPANQLCERPPEKYEEITRLSKEKDVQNKEVCWVKGGRLEKPIFIWWQEFPRVYPPGQLIYFLPEALLYRFTDMPFRWINNICLAKLFVTAFLCLVLIFRLTENWRPREVAWLVMWACTLPLLHFAMEGQYESIGVLFILASVSAVKKGNMLKALLFFALSAFLHYRAIWYFPLFVYICFKIVLSVDFHNFKDKYLNRHFLIEQKQLYIISSLLCCSAFFLLVSLWGMVQMRPWLEKIDPVSIVYWKKLHWNSHVTWGFVGTTGIVLAYLVRIRQWLLSVNILWISVLLTTSPNEIVIWRLVFLLPLFVWPELTKTNQRRVECTISTLIWLFCVQEYVYVKGAEFFPHWIAFFIQRVQASLF